MVFSRKDDRLKSMEEILKNAPADSSHVSISGVYYFINCGDAMQYHEPAERWIESSGIRHLCRSLSDIRAQIQLLEKNEKLEARIVELGRILSNGCDIIEGDLMPQISKLAIQDYRKLNEFLIESKPKSNLNQAEFDSITKAAESYDD